MARAYEESFEKYRTEDGEFVTEKEMTRAQRKRITALGVQVYDKLYSDQRLTNGTKLRFFRNRSEVDLACLFDGAFPEAADEIAIDRMYADNNELSIGDTVTIGEEAESAGRSFRITGFIALPDYNALFENNSDTMFDALQFGVGVVTDEAFTFDKGELTWEYAWRYDDPPSGKKEAADRAETFRKELQDEVILKTFIPRDENQGIYYAGEDVSRDQTMMTILLYIIIVIMAFVFAVTISNTITKEASVIGTLRAMGFTRSELVRHYMVLPMLVTLVSGVVGNILGYTLLKDYAAGLYYNSYSLPTYVTVWNADAFVMTTVIPAVIMAAITLLVLAVKLRVSPLQFLRGEPGRRKSGGTIRLGRHLPFMSRFRLRVIFQNAGSYVVLFIGILFANRRR